MAIVGCIKGVIQFDLDGTLIDSDRLKKDLLFDRAVNLLHHVDDKVLQRFLSRSSNRFGYFFSLYDHYQSYYRSRQIQSPYDLLQRFEKKFIESLDRQPSLVNFSEVIRLAAERRILVGISSATPSIFLYRILKSLGMINQVKFCFGAEVEKCRVPAYVADIAGVDNRNYLIVGNGLDDMEAAEKAGVGFCGVNATPCGIEWDLKIRDVGFSYFEE